MGMNDTKRQRKYVLVSSVFSILLLAGFIWNTIHFYTRFNYMVEEYVENSNYELAENITLRLKTSNEFIRDFADTLSRMPEHLLTEDLLKRKADAIGLDQVIVLTKDERQKLSWIGDGAELAKWNGLEKAWGEAKISVLNDKNFIYSVPVKKEGNIEKVVVGIESYGKIREMIHPMVHWKQGFQILADKETGRILILEKDEDSRLTEYEIENLVKKVKSENYEEKMYDKGYIISSAYIEGTEWVQITAENDKEVMSLLSQNIRIYFILILAVSAFFLIFLFEYRKDLKKREKLFLTDTITGGYNREGFLQFGQKYQKHYGNEEYTIVSLNICEFRKINELWGEVSGNKMLRFVYRILSEGIGEHELVCRSSMDHFLLLLREKKKEKISERVEESIQRINADVHKSFNGYHVEFAIGCCQLSMEQSLPVAISKGIYVSKQGGEKNRCIFYDAETAQKIKEEDEINELFQKSLENHDFQIYLQPKISRSGEVQAEALVRWVHPERGMIYPNQFIPLFERNGKIGELDLYVFEEVCRMMAEWMKDGKELMEISVNLSRFTLRETGKDIWGKYKAIKEKYQIPNDRIEIELTETALIDEHQIAYIQQLINGLRSCGFKVALDDFGFAYSSLALLKSFEVDTIKLDRSFFIDETTKSKKIVANIIQLAHNLDMNVVAEGIEEFEQVESLWRSECDFIQGYVYSKPLSREEFGKWRAGYEEQEH